MAFKEIAVLGPGLLGGSIGLALRERGLGEVRFWGRSEEKLEKVREAGFFASRELAEVVKGVELVILATPVGFYPELAEQLVGVGGDFVVSDVGSVKDVVEKETGSILRAGGITFVGSHPMAGSEQGGFEAARADLFEGATCFICPEGHDELSNELRVFWKSLACSVKEISAGEHDQLVARISHLPHALSSVAARVALRNQGEGQLGGGGLVDTTRVAAGNPEMWTGILLENQEAVMAELRRASEELVTLRELLASQNQEGLVAWLVEAKKLRNDLK